MAVAVAANLLLGAMQTAGRMSAGVDAAKAKVAKVPGVAAGAKGAKAVGENMQKMGKMAGDFGKFSKKMLGKGAGMVGINMSLSSMMRQSQVFTGVLGAFFQIVGGFIDVILAPFMPLLSKVIAVLGSKIPWVAEWAQKIYDWMEKHVFPIIRRIFNWIGEKIRDVYDWIVEKLPLIIGFLTTVKDKVIDVYDWFKLKIWPTIDDYIQTFKDIFEEYWQTIKQVFKPIWEELPGVIKPLWDAFKPFIATVSDILLATLKPAFKILMAILKFGVLEILWPMIKIALKLLEWAFRLPLWIKDGVIGAFNWLKKGWDWASDWVKRIWANLRIMIANIWDALEYGNTKGANKLRDEALKDLRSLEPAYGPKQPEIVISLEQQIKDDMGGNITTTQEQFNLGENAFDTKIKMHDVKLAQESYSTEPYYNLETIQ